MSESEFIHRFIPAKAESGARTLVLLHGTGGDENDMIHLGSELDPGAALLSPRGKVLENGMPRFFRRLAEGVFDQEDVIRRADELADFVGACVDRYALDPKRIIATGYSNGANIAAAILLLRPELFSQAVLFRAMVPLIPESLANLTHRRILICSGDRDPIVPTENPERLGSMLRDAGAEVELHFEHAGHALVPEDIEYARNWLGN